MRLSDSPLLLAAAALSLAGLFVVVPACGAGTSDEAASAPLDGVVLILLDTLRADRLGCYGHDRETSPHIDALAADGVRFESVVSCAPWTLPATAAILSGRYPFGGAGSGREPLPSIVEGFRAAGFRTAAFTEGGYVSRTFGLDRGFELWEEQEGAVRLFDGGVPVNAPGDGQGDAGGEAPAGGIERTFARARAWLAEHADERFFLLVHTYEPHTPYTNRDFAADLDPGRLDEQFVRKVIGPRIRSGQIELTAVELEYLRALYDGDILSSDRQVGALVATLDELGLADRVLVCVTSDHGEELGEHYPSEVANHGHALLETAVRVPLVMRDPGAPASARGRVVPTRVRTLDILPTIATRLGIALAPEVEGQSLLALMAGASERDRGALVGWTKIGPTRAGLYQADFKYVETLGQSPQAPRMLRPPAPRQLYDLARDPAERVNEVERRPELTVTLHEALLARTFGRATRVDVDLESADSELLERLRSLGYVE